MAKTEIRIENLHKSFGGVPVIDGIDLEVLRGEFVAVVGGSGCGKTVLLKLVIGHLKPELGKIYIANHDVPGHPLVDVTALDDEELDQVRVHSAVVFQRNALFSASVYENIALWLREYRHLDEATIQKRARQAIDEVGFEGDETILKKQRHELSGGMAKRVAIARALAMRPTIMYYDEPTTGLDPANAASIHDLIRFTHNRKIDDVAPTTLVITHDKDLLTRLRPRVVMLHEGRVFFDGRFEEFEAADSPIIRPYFELMPVLQQRSLPA